LKLIALFFTGILISNCFFSLDGSLVDKIDSRIDIKTDNLPDASIRDSGMNQKDSTGNIDLNQQLPNDLELQTRN
jgi:hypothetical protein